MALQISGSGNICGAKSLAFSGGTGIVNATWTTANRPTYPNLGQMGYNTTYDTIEAYNGNAWIPFSGVGANACTTFTGINTFANSVIINGQLTSSNTATFNGTTSMTGAVVLGNTLSSNSNISTTGNVTGAYLFGNASQLTGLPAGYSNTDAAAFLASFGSNTITTTGNITSGNISTTGNALIQGNLSVTGNVNFARIDIGYTENAQFIIGAGEGGNQPGSDNGYTRALVFDIYDGYNYQPTMLFSPADFGFRFAREVTIANGVVSVDSMSDIYTAGVHSTYITSDNGANIGSTLEAEYINASAEISAIGNVTGNVFSGNGALLTDLNGANIVGGYGNANVAANLAAFGSNPISTTGNITGNVFTGNGSGLTSLTGGNVTGNVPSATIANTVTNPTQSNITAVGTLTAVNTSGAVSAAGNVTANNISALGTVYANTFSAPNGTFTILSNLDVKGNVTYIESNVVTINDVNITLANNAANATQADGGGFTINGANASFTFSAASNNFVSSQGITTNANIGAGYFVGNGSTLSSINGSNVTGTVSSATTATSATSATTAGTVTGNAQANITSVGTLTSLVVTGNTTSGNFIGNGQYLTSIPGGNVSGAVANATFATNAGSATTATSATTAGTVTGNAQANITSVGTLTSLTVSGNTTSGNFIGDGSLLTNITGANVTGIVANATTAANVAVGGITGLGTNVATFLATPSSTNFAAAITGETGTGNVVFDTSPTLVTPLLGTPTSGTLTNCTVDGTNKVGFREIPQNAQNTSYTLVLADDGKHIYNASGASITYTIPANSSVAYPIGTAVTFVNMAATALSIAITSDTMYLGGTGTTGTRTLAQYGSATALKITSTSWIITGSGLT